MKKWLKRFWYNLWNKEEKEVEPTPVVVQIPEPEIVAEPIPEVTNAQIEDFKFVDSSHHHPQFDPDAYLAAFKTGRAFLSNKCTQGLTFVDKTHAKRKQQCEERGIRYSGYHFYMYNLDPILQAQFYFKTHGKFTSPPQVDYETTTGQTEAHLYADKEDLLKFLIEIERLTGMIPWLYLNYGAAGRLKFDKRFAKYIAWFARYNSFLGPIPFPWTEETVGAWQYTEKGGFAGFDGGNDVNVYYGKVNALNLE